MNRKLTDEEKEYLEKRIHEAGIDEREKPIEITLTDEKKEALKKMIADAERDKLKRFDRVLRSRDKKK